MNQERQIFRGASLQAALIAAARFDQGVDFFDRKATKTQLPYAEIIEASGLLASAMRRRGVQPRDRVVLILGTSRDLILSIFGTLLAGASIVCLPTPRLGRMPNYQTVTSEMIRTAGARLVISDEKTIATLSPGFSDADDTHFATIAQLESDSSDSLVMESQPGDAAIIQFSSGTTGKPKPIVLTHNNILRNCEAILETFPGDISEHRGASWLPLHHDMGMIGGLFSAVVGQGSIALVRPEDFAMRPLLWLRAISETGATVSPAPNFAMQMCVDRSRPEDKEGLDLSNWSIALIGAEHVRAITLDRFYAAFADCGFRFESFTPVYGLAEATLAVTFSAVASPCKTIDFDPVSLGEGRVREVAPGESGISLTSVGTPIGDVQIQIRDEAGRALGDGRVGALFVAGASVMEGYLDSGMESPVSDGWLDTGDLGFFYEGELFIYGRTRDLLIINGRNIDPHTVEVALESVPGFQSDRVAAIPIDDVERGSETFAVLAEKDRALPSDQLRDAADQARKQIILSTGLVPRAVHIVDAGHLPRTTSGKIKRGEAQRLFLAGEITPLCSAVAE